MCVLHEPTLHALSFIYLSEIRLVNSLNRDEEKILVVLNLELLQCRYLSEIDHERGCDS